MKTFKQYLLENSKFSAHELERLYGKDLEDTQNKLKAQKYKEVEKHNDNFVNTHYGPPKEPNSKNHKLLIGHGWKLNKSYLSSIGDEYFNNGNLNYHDYNEVHEYIHPEYKEHRITTLARMQDPEQKDWYHDGSNGHMITGGLMYDNSMVRHLKQFHGKKQ